MYIEIFVEHVNIEAKQAKLVRHDFTTLKGAIAFIRANKAGRVGHTIEAKSDKGRDKITTYKGINGNYFLTRRIYK